MSRSLVPAALTVLIALGACSTFQPGKTVVKYEAGTEEIMTKTPEGGTYALYDSSDFKPKVTVNLEKGQSLGFKREEGRVYAIAGDARYAISDMEASHYWNLRQK